MSSPTHKVLKKCDAERPFTLDTFVITEISERVTPGMEVLEEGSHGECVAFVRNAAKRPGSSGSPNAQQYQSKPKKSKKKTPGTQAAYPAKSQGQQKTE